MGSFSDYLEQKMLEHLFRSSAFTQSSKYIALFSSDPADDASGNELVTGTSPGYARKLHNTWTAASNRTTKNSGVIEFATATGDWLTATHWAIFDALTSGNMLAHGSLDNSIDVLNGNTPVIKDQEIQISFSAGVITNAYAHLWLDHVFEGTSWASPTSGLALALSTADPTDAGTGLAEPSGGAYDRVAATSWNAYASAKITNDGALTFPTPTLSWGTITHACICASGTPTTADVILYKSIGNLSVGIGYVVEFDDEAIENTVS
jgi:hypothetical protein